MPVGRVRSLGMGTHHFLSGSQTPYSPPPNLTYTFQPVCRQLPSMPGVVLACKCPLCDVCRSCQVAEELCKVAGVKKVLVAQHDAYKGSLPGRCRLRQRWLAFSVHTIKRPCGFHGLIIVAWCCFLQRSWPHWFWPPSCSSSSPTSAPVPLPSERWHAPGLGFSC